MLQLIKIETFGDCRRAGYRISVFCPSCSHHAAVDLAALNRDQERYTCRRPMLPACREHRVEQGTYKLPFSVSRTRWKQEGDATIRFRVEHG
jgi:hypothetical protein